MALNRLFSLQMLPSASWMHIAITNLANDLQMRRDEPIKKAVDDAVRPTVGASFTTEGRVGGDSWAPLAEQTPFMGYRAYHNAPYNPILRVTGTLYEEATSARIWNFRGRTEGAAVVYTHSFINARNSAGNPYAVYMQEGVPNNLGLSGGLSPVPARPFLRVDEDDMNHIEEIFRDWFSERAHIRLATGQLIGSLLSGRSVLT